MSVHIDNARREYQSVGINAFVRLAIKLADLSDPPVLNRDIRRV